MILFYGGENVRLTAKQIFSAQEDGLSLANAECRFIWSGSSAGTVTNVFFFLLVSIRYEDVCVPVCECVW